MNEGFDEGYYPYKCNNPITEFDYMLMQGISKMIYYGGHNAPYIYVGLDTFDKIRRSKFYHEHETDHGTERYYFTYPVLYADLPREQFLILGEKLEKTS